MKLNNFAKLGFEQLDKNDKFEVVDDYTQNYFILKDKGVAIHLNDSILNEVCIVAKTIIPDLLQAITPSDTKDNLVIINAEVLISEQIKTDKGLVINKYFVKYGSSKINVTEFGNSNIYEKGVRIGIVGTLKENWYKDKEGKFKSYGNEIQAIRVSSDKEFRVSLLAILELNQQKKE